MNRIRVGRDSDNESKDSKKNKLQLDMDRDAFEKLIAPDEGQRIADQARTWSDTPYLSGGKVKGTNGGTDCSHSTNIIYEEAGFPYAYKSTKNFAKSPNFSPSPNNIPQVGDVGLYEGHMLIYDPNAGSGMDSWSAFHSAKPNKPARAFGPANSSWPQWKGQVKWYRYRKQGST